MKVLRIEKGYSMARKHLDLAALFIGAVVGAALYDVALFVWDGERNWFVAVLASSFTAAAARFVMALAGRVYEVKGPC